MNTAIVTVYDFDVFRCRNNEITVWPFWKGEFQISSNITRPSNTDEYYIIILVGRELSLETFTTIYSHGVDMQIRTYENMYFVLLLFGVYWITISISTQWLFVVD